MYTLITKTPIVQNLGLNLEERATNLRHYASHNAQRLFHCSDSFEVQFDNFDFGASESQNLLNEICQAEIRCLIWWMGHNWDFSEGEKKVSLKKANLKLLCLLYLVSWPIIVPMVTSASIMFTFEPRIKRKVTRKRREIW